MAINALLGPVRILVTQDGKDAHVCDSWVSPAHGITLSGDGGGTRASVTPAIQSIDSLSFCSRIRKRAVALTHLPNCSTN